MIQLEGFELIREVDRTDYSITYQANQVSENRLVFVKFFPREAAKPQVYRFGHEASSQAKLLPPYFQQILDIGSMEEGPYLIQENLDGITLEQLLAGPRIALTQAIAFDTAFGIGDPSCALVGVSPMQPHALEHLLITRKGAQDNRI